MLTINLFLERSIFRGIGFVYRGTNHCGSVAFYVNCPHVGGCVDTLCETADDEDAGLG